MFDLDSSLFILKFIIKESFLKIKLILMIFFHKSDSFFVAEFLLLDFLFEGLNLIDQISLKISSFIF